MSNLKKNKILLIVTGSIAAYKVLDFIRLAQKKNIEVTCVLTKAGSQFVTPLSLASLSGNPVYEDVFSLDDETQMGHIKLARSNDIILVAPASADIIGKMANGLSNDLASTILLATDKPVLIAPAMNVQMWKNKAVQRNVSILKKDGVLFIGPNKGELACKEEGEGRFVEPEELLKAVLNSI